MATGPQLFYRLWQDRQICEGLFEELSKEDICNVRLASSACCNLVTKRLFKRTHLTFTANSFTRLPKIQALSRIGHYIEHLTFYFPHSNATFLPPLIHPQTGREISFLYKPHTSMGSVLERPKFANEGLGEMLTSQYPPLFHAASNVPSFINAMKHLTNVRHLSIKTPGQNPQERYRRDIVDYALISLRVALERVPMKKLNKLSLSVHPSAFLYLRAVQGFGCSPSAGRRWKQIRKMHINVDSWDFYGPSPGLDHLKIIQDFLQHHSTNLEKLSFTWYGRKGPCPIALAADPLFAPPRNSLKLFHEITSPMSPLPPVPPRKPVVFRKLRYLAIRNATMNAAQVADLVASHQQCVREFDFENSVLISDGNWDDALAPLMNSNFHGGYWTRHSVATVTELTSAHYNRTPLDLYEPQPSAAVAAVARNLYNIDIEEAEHDGEYEEHYEEHYEDHNEDHNEEPYEGPYEEHSDEFDVELDSDVEAARQASLSAANKTKKRTVTKRRRKRKPGHERRDEREEERQTQRARQHRGRHRQRSNGPHEEHHDRPNRPLHHPLEPPQLTFPRQPSLVPSHGNLFGEVDSVYSTNPRPLFGEVTPISRTPTTRTPVTRSRSGSGSGSEPELSHSPSDDADSGDDYFRPHTPTTPDMNISAPILDTSPNMPTLLQPTLLQPTVYDPTADLCSEITAIQRDIEEEEQSRLFAEEEEMQTSALRRAKELVLTRLGKEFGTNTNNTVFGGRLSPRKETFGAPTFLSSARFKESLFGKSNTHIPNPAASNTARLYTRPSGLQKYLYTDASGRRAWAFVTGASNGIGKSLAIELASHGFNVVIHGRNTTKLEGVRRELQTAYPSIDVRIIVADASQCHRAQAVDFDHIRDQLAELHLTVLVNCAGAGPQPAFGGLETYDRDVILDNLHLNAVFPALLTSALVPVLRGQYSRGANTTGEDSTTETKRPALILNIGSVTDDGFPLISFYSAGKAATHTLHKALAREAALDGWDEQVEIISHRVGAVTEVSHTQAPPTLFRPAARTIAKAVLARTGCGRNVVAPYWPHALQQALIGLLPAWMLDRVINIAMREERKIEKEEVKKGL
ncbi:hypothetical protein F4808DRAFT_447481 [Astrocystis sublimbata]|nr:hypothetical protein F4808DRAFT_447481 [Astrocystis sublimbata]